MLQGKKITVFGGTGFLGRFLLQKLAKEKAVLRIGARKAHQALFLKTMGNVGQITLADLDINNKTDVFRFCKGTDYIVNLVGLFFEKKQFTFNKIHIEGAENIAQAAHSLGVKGLVHTSALGAHIEGSSLYAQSKAKAEQAILSAFPDATILRPSLLFGSNDYFFNTFAQLSALSPFLPLFGGGHTKFQPVYAGDVADAIIACLKDQNTHGKVFELGGPDIYSFKELLQLILQYTQRRSRFINIPYPAAKCLAFFAQHFPKPFLTPDQVELLKTDSVVQKKSYTFKTLKIAPHPLETFLEKELERYRPHF